MTQSMSKLEKTPNPKYVEATFIQKKCLLNFGNLTIMAIRASGLGSRSGNVLDRYMSTVYCYIAVYIPLYLYYLTYFI